MSQQINLFNPVFLRQEKLFSALTMVQAVAVIAVALLGFSGYKEYRFSGVRADAIASEIALKNAKDRLAMLVKQGEALQPDAALKDAVHRAEERLRGYRSVHHVMQSSDVGNTNGYSEHFRAFARNASSDLWLTGFTIEGAGNASRISGRAMQPELVPAYITSLKLEPVFRGTSFARLDIRAAAPSGGRQDDALSGGFVEFSLSSAADGESSR